jgi:predicted nuclease of predicted toxin-antitoxin system
MKFLVDMPLSPELAAWLVESGHEAVHVLNLGLHRASDVTILERAREDERVVVTADLDYPRILALTQSQGPGLILFRGGNYSEAESVARLRRALQTIPAEELAHSIIVIEKDRIRRRRLSLEPNP